MRGIRRPRWPPPNWATPIVAAPFLPRRLKNPTPGRLRALGASAISAGFYATRRRRKSNTGAANSSNISVAGSGTAANVRPSKPLGWSMVMKV